MRYEPATTLDSIERIGVTAFIGLILTALTVLAIARIFVWALRQMLAGIRTETAIVPVDDLSCGCADTGIRYGCIHCSHTRCTVHAEQPHECTRDEALALNAWAGCDGEAYAGTERWADLIHDVRQADDDVLLHHEALPEVDEIGPPKFWQALDKQCADLKDLADQLGGTEL